MHGIIQCWCFSESPRTHEAKFYGRLRLIRSVMRASKNESVIANENAPPRTTYIYRQKWGCWGDITTLHEILQNLHPNIKFTVETSKKEIPFLDILIIKNGCKIITDIYRKPTDTQQYLHFKSHHPKTCRTSIPYTLARRICTIIVPSALRNIRLNELRNVLKERGYPITLIDKGIELANSLPLNILRQAKVKDSKQPLAFVSTFNRRNPELFTEAYNHLNNLRMDDKLNDILNNTKVIKSKRQPNNLKQILTHAKFSKTNNDENYEVKKCNDRRCKVCEILIEGKVFKFKNCHTEFEVKRNFVIQKMLFMLFNAIDAKRNIFNGYNLVI